MDFPEDLLYSNDHEWVRVDGNRVVVGITDYAQDALGDVVFVQQPDVGRTVTAGDSIGEVESTKSVSDIYSPVGGRVVEVNESLAEQPEALNNDPYGSGWLFVVEVSNTDELDRLLDAAGYRTLVEG
jgi:glycine cleavage system H protein